MGAEVSASAMREVRQQAQALGQAEHKSRAKSAFCACSSFMLSAIIIRSAPARTAFSPCSRTDKPDNCGCVIERKQLQRSTVTAAGYPGPEHRYIPRTEGYHVGAISGDKLAERVTETDKRRRI
jgi:hypothetical protein